MPLPINQKILLSTLLLPPSGTPGGYRLILPNGSADLTPVVPGIPATGLLAAIDLTGNARPELIVGVPGDDEGLLDAGRVYVTFDSVAPTTGAVIGTATSSQITIDGANAGDRAGYAVGTIADLNGDGITDILVGAPMMENGAATDAGAAFVVWGSNVAGDISLSDPANGAGDGFIMRGQAAGDHVGTALAAIADLNGDGKMEILVNATGNDAGGGEAGAAYVVWGTDLETPINLSDVAAGKGGFRIIGQAAGDSASQAIGSVADMNGDGLAEILVGAPGNDAGGADAGAVYVVFGKSTGTQVDLDAVAAGTGGFRITGAAGERVGNAISSLGDVNRDGRADILVGAPGSDKAYVVFGKATTGEVVLSNLAASKQGFAIRGAQPGDLANMTVAAGGDFNRDGVADYLIGAPGDDEGGPDVGAVYVIWGGNHATVELSLINSFGAGGAKIVGSSGAGTGFGTSVTAIADMNADGTPDIMAAGRGGGALHVIFSSPNWQPDPNVYGSNDADVIGIGDGNFRKIGAGNDELYGFGGNDTLAADGGDDLLDGGTGADSMDGGAGNDSYRVDDVGDRVTEALGAGVDSVLSQVSWTMDANVDNLTLTGGLSNNVTGNAIANLISGNGGDNAIDGAGGNDTLRGFAGHDKLTGGAGDDILDGGTGTNTLIGGAGNDTLDGVTAIDNTAVFSGAFANYSITTLANGRRSIVDLRAGSPDGTDNVMGGMVLQFSDRTVGGPNQAPVITSNGGGATAAVAVNENTTAVTTVTYTDDSSAIAFTLSGADAARFQIDALGNLRFINAPNAEAPLDANTNNIYEVTVTATDNGSPVLSDTQALSVSVADIDEFDVGAVADSNAAANSVAETATVGTLAGVTATASDADRTNSAITYSLDNSAGGRFAINATTGVVTVAGALDFQIASSHDIVVRATSADASFTTQVFNIVVRDVFNVINGTTAGETLTGTAADDQINGLAGADTINAGGSNDHLLGGLDNDVLNGDAGDDLIDGGDGNDQLNGGTGNDTMLGGAGDDTYIVDALGDVIGESAGGGTDTVNAGADWTLGSAVENLLLTGTALRGTGNLDHNSITGNALANTLDGNGGNDQLFGMGGDDILIGNSGIDVLTGGAGNDTLNGADGNTRAAYSGTIGNYLITRRADGRLQVLDQRGASPDGTDNVGENLTLQFTDRIYTVAIAADGSAEGNQGSPIAGTVSAFDADVDALTFSVVAGPASGTLALNADGSYLYTPNAGFSGADAFTFVANDGRVDSNVATVSLTVVPGAGNQAPVITSDGAGASASLTMAENTTAVTTVTQTDVDSANFTYSLSGVDAARFKIDALGQLSFVNAPNAETPNDSNADNVYQVTVTVTDDGSPALTDSQALSVSVGDEDEFDVGAITDANAATNAVAENAAVGALVGIAASASDADRTTNAITYSLDNNAGGRFAINATSGAVSLAAALNYELATSHSITVRANSADGSSSTQVFNINVSDVDEFDVGAVIDSNAATNSVAENAALGTVVGLTAFASDADGSNNAITYALDNNAGGRFAINASTGVVSVAGALDFETNTSHSVVVRATSTDGSFAAQSFTIAVTDIVEGGLNVINGTNNNDTLTGTAADDQINGLGGADTVNAGAGNDQVFGGIGNDNMNGQGGNDLLDGGDGNDLLTGGTGNDTMQGGLGNDNYNVDALADVVVEQLNAGVDAVSSGVSWTLGDHFENLTLTGTAANGTGNALNNVITGNASANSLAGGDGDDQLLGQGGSDTLDGGAGVNQLTGGGGNDTLSGADANTRAIFSGQFADYQITRLAAPGRLSVADQRNGSPNGTDNVGDNLTLQFTNRIYTVAVASNGAGEGKQGSTINGLVSASDADGDALTYAVVTGPANGTLVLSAAGSYTYTPNAAFSGADSFSFRANDGTLTSNIATVALTVNPGNQPPAITSNGGGATASLTVAENTTAVTTLTQTDSDSSSFSYALSGADAARFKIDALGALSFVSAPNAEAPNDANTDNVYQVTVTVSDNGVPVQSDSQALSVTIGDVDEFNVGAVADSNAAANSVAENAAIGTSVGLTAAATDPDRTTNAITYALDDSAGGRFAIDATSGLVSVAASLNFELNTSHNITVRATSADGSASTQVFVIALTDVDEFDVGAITDNNAAANSVAENSAAGTLVGLTGSASDGDGSTNAISYSLDNDAGARFAINTTTGVVSAAGPLDFETSSSHTIIVRATSADGSFSTQNFTIAVTDVVESVLNVINGTNNGETLTGTGADDQINALGGSDIINAGTGNDQIFGGLGNDTLNGQAGNDLLDGGDGNDVLTGGTGNDTMQGGLGNDNYSVDSLADVVIEQAGAGTDSLTSTLNWTLGENFENLTLSGSAAIGAGNALGNRMTGNAAANTLDGADGNDQLLGLAGNDILTGGLGADTFIFNSALGATNVDAITDYVAADDVIHLENAIFAALGNAGALNANAFFAGSAAADSSDRIIYDQTSGALYYDADGTGAAAQTRVATLNNLASLSAGEFLVI